MSHCEALQSSNGAFIHSFIRSFARSLARPPAHWLVRSFIHEVSLRDVHVFAECGRTASIGGESPLFSPRSARHSRCFSPTLLPMFHIYDERESSAGRCTAPWHPGRLYRFFKRAKNVDEEEIASHRTPLATVRSVPSWWVSRVNSSNRLSKV